MLATIKLKAASYTTNFLLVVKDVQYMQLLSKVHALPTTLMTVNYPKERNYAISGIPTVGPSSPSRT